MAIYVEAGVTKAAVTTTWTTMDISGAALDRNPNSSDNPFTLNSSTDEITCSETAEYLVLFSVSVVHSSTNPGTADFAEIRILADNAGSTFSDLVTEGQAYLNKAEQTIAVVGVHSFVSGEKIKVEAQTSAQTVNFLNGKLVLWRDGLLDAGVAPDDAQYLTLATDGDLDNERVFTPGTGISGSDGGAGGNYTVSMDINGLTSEASIDSAADYIPIYDTSAGAIRKALPDDLGIGGGGEANTASNLGAGATVFKQKTGVDLEFNSLLSVAPISAVLDAANGEIDLTFDIGVLTEDTAPKDTDYLVKESTTGTIRKSAISDVAARPDEAFVTIGTATALTSERALTAGEGVTYTDGGAGGNVTLNLNAPGLNAFTAPLSSDYFIIYDDTAKEHKRITLANLQRVQQAASVATSVVAGAGGGPMLAACLSAHIAGMAESAFAGTPIADAVTALQDFQTNGDWRNLTSAAVEQVTRALQVLDIYQTYAPAGT